MRLRGRALGVALGLILALPDPARAAAGASTAGRFSATEGPVYLIGSVELRYAEPHPEHPPLEDVLDVDLALGEAADGYVGPRRGGQNVWFRLTEIAEGPPIRVYATGVRELNEQIVDELNRRGLIGVYVAPRADDIEPDTGRDLRDPGDTALHLLVYTGRAQGLRTFASGSRVGERERIDNSAHAMVARHSPVQPAGVGGRGEGDLLRREQLDEYLALLNRHPGRHVDVTFTPSRTPGGVYLDYLVAEDKPWTAYMQVADTGTDATADWQQRFGAAHFQLTGRDDVLRLDYVTGEFDEVQAVIGSYQVPVFGPRLRARVRGSWTDYEASQFGIDDGFEGRQWTAGADLLANVLQRGDLFVDASAGVRWLNIEAHNLLTPEGDESFLAPQLGLGVERARDESVLRGSLGIELGLGGSSDPDELLRLGRPDVDEDWMRLTWDVAYSFYLEPLVDRRAWSNPLTPSSSTLAHEVLLRTEGQYAFGDRLIAQVEQVFGGFYTVRGYPQALLASDSGVVVSAEYRYHVPRAFALEPEPRELPVIGRFRVAPDRVYGRPDWDLVLRGFFDFGRAIYSDAAPGEEDETLSSLGVGIELLIDRYIGLSLRLDWAVALQDVRDAEAGDSEAHFLATLRY